MIVNVIPEKIRLEANIAISSHFVAAPAYDEIAVPGIAVSLQQFVFLARLAPPTLNPTQMIVASAHATYQTEYACIIVAPDII